MTKRAKQRLRRAVEQAWKRNASLDAMVLIFSARSDLKKTDRNAPAFAAWTLRATHLPRCERRRDRLRAFRRADMRLLNELDRGRK
jgi:hypothetical protein